MKGNLLLTAAAIAAGAMAWTPAASLADALATDPGIVTSVGGSAVISTEGMPPGGEIWAEWYSLPPGKAVDESATTPKWAYVEMALSGSAGVTGDPAPMCRFISAGGVQAAVLPATHTDNRGSEPYVFAGLAVGGPWVESMEDSSELYLKVNGLAKVAQISTSNFSQAEKEILKAGAMTLAIRNITMPPGSRVVKTDHYPTVRMIENGQLTWGFIPQGSDAAAAPTKPEVSKAFDMTQWAPDSADKPFVLINDSDQPVQFVEWTIAPAPAAKP